MYRKALSKKRTRYDNTGSGKSKQGAGHHNKASIDYRSKMLYPRILANPFVANPDVRIPDGLAMIPTSTFDVHYEFDLVTGSNNVGGFCLGLTGKPQLWRLHGNATATDFKWDMGQGGLITTGTNGVTATSFASIANNLKNNTVIPSEEFWSAADTAYRGWRLVAAGCKTEFIGNDQNNEGVIQGMHIKGGTIATHVPNRYFPEPGDLSGSSAVISTQPLYSEATTYVTNIADWGGARLHGVTSVPANVVLPPLTSPVVFTASTGTTTEITITSAASNAAVAAVVPDLFSITSVDQIRLSHGAVTKPAKDGLKLVYTPGCASDYQYGRPNTASTRTLNEGNTGRHAEWDYISNRDNVPANTTYAEFDEELVTGPFKKFYQINDSGNGCLLCIVSGAAVNKTSHKVRVSLHYEALPEPNINLSDNGKIAAPAAASVQQAALTNTDNNN